MIAINKITFNSEVLRLPDGFCKNNDKQDVGTFSYIQCARVSFNPYCVNVCEAEFWKWTAVDGIKKIYNNTWQRFAKCCTHVFLNSLHLALTC